MGNPYIAWKEEDDVLDIPIGPAWFIESEDHKAVPLKENGAWCTAEEARQEADRRGIEFMEV